MEHQPMARALVGCLIGQAVGDALGLPYEGLSPERARRLFGPFSTHQFLFQRGMASDDTEHAYMVARALLESGGEPAVFGHNLARQLRWWLVGLPAGIGRATLYGCLRLWLGISPAESGVRSAGNGPAMRAPLTGVLYGDQPERLLELVRISTRLTHRDDLAEQGALLIALAAGSAARRRDFFNATRHYEPTLHEDWKRVLKDLKASLLARESTRIYARKMGLQQGVSGYILHTVPVALHAWLAERDYQSAVRAVVECGGDTDTTAAIAGALAGAAHGTGNIPIDWLDRYADWPLTLARLQQTAEALARLQQGAPPEPPPPIRFYQTLPRNLLFLLIVLLHGLRRLLPPY